MLNPEAVDISEREDKVDFRFTDQSGDEVTVISLKKMDARRLAKMIRLSFYAFSDKGNPCKER